MKIKDLSRIDLPREKLAKYGPSKLKEYELMSVLLGSGVKGKNILEISKKVIQVIDSCGVDSVTVDELRSITGLGLVKSLQIISVIELGKRFLKQKPEIFSIEDVWKLSADFRSSAKEHFVVFYLDAQNRLIERQIISIGTLTQSLVHPREVFEPAVALRAAGIVVAHNHPSGNMQPSSADIAVTENLARAGGILGIEMHMHIIVTKSGYVKI